MEALNYKDVVHQSWESCDGVPEGYKIDWSRNEEKYKTPLNAIKVYQGGRVSLHTMGYRNPDLRKRLQGYGVDLQVTSQIRGLKFFTPAGEPVPKNQIEADILLLDHEHKMALRGREIHWVDTGYAPKSNQKIKARSRNKQKEADFLYTWREPLGLAITMFSFEKDFNPSRYNVVGTIRNWIHTPRLLDPLRDKSTLLLLGAGQMRCKDNFEKDVTHRCETVSEHEYLRFEEVVK